MKELSIAEKAKRYDEAKLRMSAAYNSNRCTIGFMNEIFPELKESEDEKIRKRIIQALHGDVLEMSEIKEAVDWLEKQGEQKPIKEHNVCDFCEDRYECVSSCPTKLIEEEKPADKIEPKFKVGDTIIKKHNSDILYFGSFTITDIAGGKYWYNDRIICDITKQDEWEIYEPIRQKLAKWKPSEKQIRALNDIILKGELSYVGQAEELISLYKDLKQF